MMFVFRPFALLSFVFFFVACSSSESTGASPAPEVSEAGAAGFGCCAIGDRPPSCLQMQVGRAKSAADDDCIDGADGTIADPSQPGWTKGTADDGCPRWTPPANAKTICCGCADGG